MSKIKNLIGIRFGKGIVIAKSNKTRLVGKKNPKTYPLWILKCDCGNKYESLYRHLKYQNVKSCGCLHSFNLIGQKYGKLTIINFIGSQKDKYQKSKKIWKCKCECGNECIVSQSRLISRKNQSCGCSRRLDLSGKKFGKLTVIKYIEDRNLNKKTNKKLKTKHAIWLVLCDCGTELRAEAGYLKGGKIKSCGCLKKIKTIHGEIPISLWTIINSHAKKRKILLSITPKYIWELYLKQNKKCAMSGVEISFKKRYIEYSTASLDRIDSSKGYVEGNVQWVHKWVNLMKSDMTIKEFKHWCHLISNHFKNDIDSEYF